MIKKIFNSEISHDAMEISYFQKSHKAMFIIKKIENVKQNLKLLKKTIAYLKLNDIKWISIKVNKKYNIPQNAVLLQHNKFGLVNCHIEDFKSFYLLNFIKFIEPKNIYIETKTIADEDGWIKVINPRKLKQDKLIQFQNEITKKNIYR